MKLKSLIKWLAGWEGWILQHYNFGWVVIRIMTIFKNTALIHVLVTGYGHENKLVKKTVKKTAHMQAEFPLQWIGRICLTNVSKMGINESIRYVVLIVLKPITAITASGSLWSDGALLLQSDRSTHLAALGLQEAAGEVQGHQPWDWSSLKLLY